MALNGSWQWHLDPSLVFAGNKRLHAAAIVFWESDGLFFIVSVLPSECLLMRYTLSGNTDPPIR